ncbi:SusC/RagA family TonB-linked outer membrane protein [Flavivirga rizhaonensis]|uniref:TonB-dependent receptor n=1 Tax=Flavivirga rizhaonensis TaxID=2559571 RepID=A0A4S1DUU2_9FLAO|nr:TonB-dependent receptor [Flavivirga rizhaonensis]TGV01850.1 TonB-dependent receptor [Flavivirga rizhaonensis]
MKHVIPILLDNVKALYLKSILTLFIFVLQGHVLAQTTVTGKITSKEDGMPLPGVSIVVQGTNNGAVSDFDGNYSINVTKQDAVLVFTYIGFKDQIAVVGNQSTINIVLIVDTEQLDEVVVIGYGEVKRKDLTGSVVSLKAEDLNPVQAVSFEQGLVAKAPGVQVTTSSGQPGAAAKIRIRGGTSINASSDPLYVIDGFQLLGSGNSSSLGLGNSFSSPLNSIDPADIESIEVLKDASATAIYGARGANGVIIITTKRGKAGKSELNFETFTGFSNVVRGIDVLTPQEFIDWRNEFSPYNPDADPSDAGIDTFRDEFGNPYAPNDNRVIVSNWLDEVLRPATINSYRLSFNGGNEKTKYNGAVGYLNQNGIVENSDFERFSTNLRVDQTISDKLKAGISINAGFTKNSGVVSASSSDGGGQNGLLTGALLYAPVQGPYNAEFVEGAQFDDRGRVVSLRNGDVVNPTITLFGDSNLRRDFQTFAQTYLSYKVMDGLTAKATIGGSIYSSRGKAYYSEQYGWGLSAGGRAFYQHNQGTNIIGDFNLTYNKTFGDHNIIATAVHERQFNENESLRVSSNGFNLPGVNLDALESAAVSNKTVSSRDERSIISYLGRVNYKFKDRYLLTLSGRYDGSSNFAQKWGFFPSAAIAWRVSEEPFMSGIEALSDLKLRATYGETGNNSIASYSVLAAAVYRPYIFGGSDLQAGAILDRLQQDNLTWETTKQTDFGVSFGLFDNRISVDATYYIKKTDGLLLFKPIPETSGFTGSIENAGAMSNKGFEFTLNTINIDKDDFKWTTNFNISFNRNTVDDLVTTEELFFNGFGNKATSDFILREGEPLGSFFGYQRDGVYSYEDFEEFDGLSNQEAADLMYANGGVNGWFSQFYTLKDGIVQTGLYDKYRPGMPKFVDNNGDGVVNAEDRQILGNTQPDHYGGITNNFKYKNFDLGVVMNWSYGNEVYNKNRQKGGAQSIPHFNKLGWIRDRWTPENPTSDIMSVLGDTDGDLGFAANSTQIEDGSYLRMANVTLGYNFPKDVLDRIGLRNLRLYAAGDNLFLISNYTGYDPDVSVGGNQLTPGQDIDSYPRSRQFRVGVQVGF